MLLHRRYLEYEETIKTKDYDEYQPHSAKANVPTKYKDRYSPRYKNPDPPLDAKTNPYFSASQSPIHPKITKTPSKYTRENEERGNQGLGDWFEAKLEKCWKIQQKRDNSHLDLRRQAQDDALRNWEAQIDQLRRQEHEVSECRMVHTPKNDAHQKETARIERISSLPEKPNPGSLNIPCSVDIFNINAIADLRASVNIMSESMLEELSLADPKKANIIVEMADKTSCVSQGIIENVMVKIDKFSFTSDFVIIDTKGLNNKTIILGRPFLAHIRAEINISTREVWLEIKEDRLGGQTREKTITEEQEDPDKCGETKARAIIGTMINKLPEEWFLGVSRDIDDLEGIINYLEPTLYDGFIDHNEEAYKQRRNKLLGMPYIEPPPIIKEEAEITKYNLGVGKVFMKTKILNIKEYNRVFNNEIEHLSNEYILRIGKKGYVLDDVWEKCQQNYKKTNEAWHDEAYEENEMWRIRDEKTDYDPPYDEALPLGRMNGARFKAMIRKELEGNNYVHEVT
ncbi:phospholipase-like protein [Tanacetum coccineum]|uniref:Phospholipase-like protein n=1 Tax=Tanacetum coccineum TaxID=301880 RepID=A0ABQ5HYC6_9ASTR